MANMAHQAGTTAAAQARILLISGSTRGGSTNTAALRTAGAVAPAQVTARLYDGLAGLPAFNPDDDHEPLPPAAAGLRREIAAADALVFCTPEYAGTLPGSFKNLLDWTVGGVEVSGKPVAWINVGCRGPRRRARCAGHRARLRGRGRHRARLPPHPAGQDGRRAGRAGSRSEFPRRRVRRAARHPRLPERGRPSRPGGRPGRPGGAGQADRAEQADGAGLPGRAAPTAGSPV
jgi:hypothetical protein